MLLNFRQGIVETQQPTFARVNFPTVNLIVEDTNTTITFAAGTKDYLFTEQTSVPNAWGPLVLNTDQWLYWDLNTRTGTRTFGITTVEPIVSPTAPTNPVDDQHWFDTVAVEMNVWISNAWVKKLRVFAFKLSQGKVPVSMSVNSPEFIGTQVGNTSTVYAGSLLFDAATNNVIRNGSGQFVTTEDGLVTKNTSLSQVKLASIMLNGEAQQNLAPYTVVVFTEFGKIEHADAFVMEQKRPFGIIETGAMIGQVVNVTPTGMISSKGWDWTSLGVNAPLYCSNTGSLVTAPVIPNQTPVATVMDRYTIVIGSHASGTSTSVSSSGLATQLAFGTARLSVPADDAADPVVVGDNDPRLVNARPPQQHTHVVGDINGLTSTLSGIAADVGAINTTINTSITPAITAANSRIDGVSDTITNSVQPSIATLQSDQSSTRNTLNATVATVASDSAAIASLQTTVAGKLNTAGGTMAGMLTLAADPTAPLQAATRQYVDTSVSKSSGVAPGTYGSASSIPVLSIDTSGRVTSASAIGVTIPAVPSVVSAFTNDSHYQTSVDVSNAITTSLNAYSNAGVFVSVSGGAMTGPLILNTDPTTALQAATKQYVDSVTTHSQWKSPVRVATTGVITLSGVQTIDGILLAPGDRVLVKNQSGIAASIANGIYVVETGAWTRATDADTGAKLPSGSVVYATEGNTQKTQAFVLATIGTIAVGTTPLLFTSFNNSQVISLTTDVYGTGTTSIPVTLVNSGVAAGTYTSVTVDSKGRVVAASNPTTLFGYGITNAITKTGDTMSGMLYLAADPYDALHAATKQYVDSKTSGPGIAVNGGLSLVGSALSVVSASSGRIVVNSNNIDLASSGVVAGTYNSVTVDAYGRVTNGTVSGNSTITLTGDATGSGTSSIGVTLASTGVIAGTYTSVTVDSKGRVTTGSNPTTLSGYGITNAVAKAGDAMTGFLTLHANPTNALHAATKQYVDAVIGGAITPGDGLAFTSGSTLSIVPASSTRLVATPGSLDLATTGVASGTYTSLTVDAYGRVTAASNPTAYNQPITLSGDASGTGTSSIPVTLSNTGVTAGTYNRVTTDVKGRITAATAATTLAGLGVSDSINSLNDVTITTPTLSQVLAYNGAEWVNTSPTAGVDRYVGVSGGDTAPGYLSSKLSTTSNFSSSIINPGLNEQLRLDLSTQAGVVAGGPYNTFSVDSFGRITAASNSSGSNQTITLSGDASGSGSTAITVTLANTGVSTGTYTKVTVNSKGLVTGASNPTTMAEYGLTDVQPLHTSLTNLTAVTGGLVAKHANSTYAVSIAGTSGRVTVANGAATGGTNPTIDLASGVIATPGTYTKLTVDTYGRAVAGSTVTVSDISGIGTIASQNASAVAVTGGSITGTSIAPRIVNVPYSASVTLNWAIADIIRITLTGDISIANSGGVPGQKCILELYQDATGSRAVTFTSSTRFSADVTGFTPSTTPLKLDRVGFIYNELSTTYDVVAISRGY